MNEATVAAKDEVFDLYLADKAGFFWTMENRGITARPDRIAFTIDGAPHEGPYAAIRQIKMHLQPIISRSSSGSVGWCEITFSDGYVIRVSSGDAHGLTDAAQNAAYLNFIAELHHRLSAADKQRIRFVAGVSEGRYWVLVICAGIFALMSLVPLVAFLYSGEWKILITLLATVGFAYPLWKNAQANRPRRYDPDQLPEDLVPEA